MALFEPAILAGTAVGVILNTVFPPWLIQVLLAAVLIIVILRTFTYLNLKSIFCKKKENEKTEENNQEVQVVKLASQLEAHLDSEDTKRTQQDEIEEFTPTIRPSTAIENLFAHYQIALALESTAVADDDSYQQVQISNQQASMESNVDPAKAESPMEEQLSNSVKKYLYRLKLRFPLHKIFIPVLSILIILIVSLIRGDNYCL